MAVNVVYVYIYSNDGAQVLHEYLTGANSLTVTDKGCLYNDSVEWTYEGTNAFLGFATSPNATEPTYAIGDSVALTLGGSDAFYVVERKSEPSGVTVEYNGSVIATIENGNKATLPIKDKKMKSDIVVTVPEATDSPLPVEVSTEAEMTALLESGEVGGVYKYVGETTDAYENGALYVLENNLITFTVGSNSFEAEDGMTWSEWCDSEYNTDRYSVQGSTVRIGSSAYHNYITLNTVRVKPTDTIVDSAAYGIEVFTGSGGSN